MAWSLCRSLETFVLFVICIITPFGIGSISLTNHMPPSWNDICETHVTPLDSLTKSSLRTVKFGQNQSHIHLAVNEFRNKIESISRTTGAPRAKSTPVTSMVNITCKIPRSDNTHWRLMDLHAWDEENNVNAHTTPSNRTLVFKISVECERGANISLPWPMKSKGLWEVHVRNCGLVDQLALANDPLVSQIPDELQVLSVRDSFWLVDLTTPNSIILNSKSDFIDINSDYDCGQDDTLRIYIFSNVTFKSYFRFNNVEANMTDGEGHNSSDEDMSVASALHETTTRRPVRPEDRLVTNQESLISDQRGMDMGHIPMLEGQGDRAESTSSNLTAKQDFLELLKKIKNTRIQCDFVKLLVRDESISSDSPKHLLQFSTQEATHPVLEVLNYSRIGMNKFPRELSQWRLYFPKLRYLDLSYNHISELTVEDYPLIPDNPTLIINIRHNNLSVINPDTLKTWASVKKFHVDIRNNPISCDCRLKSMVAFLRNASTFTGQLKQYEYVKHLQCHSPSSLHGKKLGSLRESELPCPTTESSDDLIIVLAIMLATFVILTIVLIRFKVEIRILLYTRLHVRLPCDSDAHRNNKLYDAFVSYSNEDSPWVLENLVKYLENEAGFLESGEKSSANLKRQTRPFKLCLHQRDFIPGKTIVNNIIDSIEASRHTIIVLSPNFMRSHWAMEELRQAYRQSLVEKTRHLIVLLLEKVSDEEMDPVIKRCVKTFTYLQVQDAIFRDKLVFSLSTKDKATRRRDRLASKSNSDCISPPSNIDTVAHTNFCYISEAEETSNQNAYDIIKLPSPRYDNINEVFQQTKNDDVTLSPSNDSGYYSLEVPYCNIDSIRHENETCSSHVTGKQTENRPNGPSRILSNSSTSSTTALVWNL